MIIRRHTTQHTENLGKNQTKRVRREARSEYTLAEKLDMRFQTYCSSVLGISLSSLLSDSMLRSIVGGMLAYAEQMTELCYLGDTYEDVRKCFAQGNPKDISDENKPLFGALVDVLKRHFERLSGGVFYVRVRKNGMVREFPMSLQMDFSLEDNGNTLWVDSLNIPLYLCFAPSGKLRLLSDEQVKDKVRTWIQDSISDLSDTWDDARRSIAMSI